MRSSAQQSDPWFDDTTQTEDVWFDDAAGPLVRLYAITQGRARAITGELDLLTLVVSVQPEVHSDLVDAEYAQLLWICERPLSVAEAAAKIDLPLCVVKVMLADLTALGYLIYRNGWTPRGAHDMDTVQKVLDGIRKL
jgi:hypothetical protein